MKKTLILMAVTMIAATGCGNGQPESEVVPAINLDNLDTSIAPGENFYDYATLGWRRANPLKPEYSRYGAFDVLADNNEIRLNELFKGLTQVKAAKGSDEQKLADLYTMGLDSLRLNAEGAAPVKPYLAELESVTDLVSFAKASGQQALYGGGSIYGTYVETDMMDSNNQILYVGESGLAMRNRDYYLLPEHAALREGYKAFLEKVFTLAGESDAAQKAQDAFDVEMAIAGPYWSMVQQRDIEAQYNPMSSAELFAAYPNLHLDVFFAELGIAPQQKLVVEQPSYFAAINKMFTDADAAKLRHYLQANVLRGACGEISDDFYDVYFDFFSRQMAGTQEQKPRWKRAMSIPNSVLGEAVGKMYVAKYFPEKDKERMLQIVKNIQASLGEHVAALDWMSDETKAKAQEKLSSFTIKIGYPDTWKDYSSLVIDPELSYYENLRAVSKWYNEDNLKELGKPVDKAKWGMSPQTVNAYYNPTTNEICFPAGILQPPFYNSNADDAVNYGAIGVVISHEMTHGFDDQGRLFDKDGNMNNWWTAEDAAAFEARAQKLVEQFNEVEVLPGMKANGEATLGENIADHGGLRIAYTAMENSWNGKHPEPVDGFTAEQRFYLAYATLWAQNITDQEITRRTLTDVHSLGCNRVNVSVRNLDTFFKAFDIKEGDAMFRPEEERVTIW
ncbi:MAG: M13 family metallopeptidase [Bacteroidales bacterium]|nr:M13 family metallopeptidase [Candidatus Cryptobacteroides caccocaballi]